MSKNKPAELMLKAEHKIAEFDKVDQQHGLSFPIPLDIALGNVEAALFSGIETASWDCIAEALVMLRQRLDPKKVKWSSR